jgi:hypothetical protein
VRGYELTDSSFNALHTEHQLRQPV